MQAISVYHISESTLAAISIIGIKHSMEMKYFAMYTKESQSTSLLIAGISWKGIYQQTYIPDFFL